MLRWALIFLIVALIAGVLHFFSLMGIALIMAGLMLGTRALTTVPKPTLTSASSTRVTVPVRPTTSPSARRRA